MHNKIRYGLEYSKNKMFFDYFVKACYNTEALLNSIDAKINMIDTALKDFLNRVPNDDAERLKILPLEEIINQEPAMLMRLNFFRELEEVFGEDIIDLQRLFCERDLLEGKLEMQKVNIDVWQGRIDLYAPKFEKDSAEANEYFDEIWEKATKIASRNPIVAAALNSYPHALQNDPKTYDQDLKNELYKSLKSQIEFDKNDSKKLLKKV